MKKKQEKFYNSLFPAETGELPEWITQYGKPAFLPVVGRKLRDPKNKNNERKLAHYAVKPEDDDVLQDLWLDYLERRKHSPGEAERSAVIKSYNAVYQRLYDRSKNHNFEEGNQHVRLDDVSDLLVAPLRAVEVCARLGSRTKDAELYKRFESLKKEEEFGSLPEIAAYLTAENITFRHNEHALELEGCPCCFAGTASLFLQQKKWQTKCSNLKCCFEVETKDKNRKIPKLKFRQAWFLAIALVLRELNLMDEVSSVMM